MDEIRIDMFFPIFVNGIIYIRKIQIVEEEYSKNFLKKLFSIKTFEDVESNNELGLYVSFQDVKNNVNFNSLSSWTKTYKEIYTKNHLRKMINEIHMKIMKNLSNKKLRGWNKSFVIYIERKALKGE